MPWTLANGMAGCGAGPCDKSLYVILRERERDAGSSDPGQDYCLDTAILLRKTQHDDYRF